MDDHKMFLNKLKFALKSSEVSVIFQLESFSSITKFISRLDQNMNNPDIILLDYNLGDSKVNGISLTRECRRIFPHAAIFLFSVVRSATAVSGARIAGADDFISKSTKPNELAETILQTYEMVLFKRGRIEGQQSGLAEFRSSQPTIVGPTLKDIDRRIPFLLRSASSVVHIEGEYGTGKKTIVELLRSYLPESQPLIKVNCSELAANSIDAELFGEKKGPGITGLKKGALEQAHNGWVFLEEIGTIPINTQAALLHAIDTKEIRRIGDTKTVPCNFKLIAASSEPIDGLVKEKRLREDLCQRLKGMEIRLPPLRDRMTEVRDFIKHFCKTLDGGPYTVTEPASEVLCSHDWRQGNLNELKSVLMSMTSFHNHRTLSPMSIPDRFYEQVGPKKDSATYPIPPQKSLALAEDYVGIQLSFDGGKPFEYYSDLLFLELIRKLKIYLEHSHQRFSLRYAARFFQMSRDTIASKLKKLSKNNLLTEEENSVWG